MHEFKRKSTHYSDKAVAKANETIRKSEVKVENMEVKFSIETDTLRKGQTEAPEMKKMGSQIKATIETIINRQNHKEKRVSEMENEVEVVIQIDKYRKTLRSMNKNPRSLGHIQEAKPGKLWCRRRSREKIKWD